MQFRKHLSDLSRRLCLCAAAAFCLAANAQQEVAEKQDVESSMGLLHAIVDAPGTLPPPQEAPAAAQNKLQKVPPVPGGLRRG